MEPKDLVYRELEPREVEELSHLAHLASLVDLGEFRVFGAIDPVEGRVVATQGLMQMTHWEGYWVAKDWRGRRELRARLSNQVHRVLREMERQGAFVIALDNQPAVRKAIEEQGGKYVGQLWMIPTKEA